MSDLLASAYLWIKALHIAAVISWMAALFYLPRLYVYHAERAKPGTELSETLKIMEEKLARIIMRPAMIVTWVAGIALALTPGMIDWGAVWPWGKLLAILALTGFHMLLVKHRKAFSADTNTRPGRHFRILNEVPTILMLIIVILVVVKPV